MLLLTILAPLTNAHDEDLTKPSDKVTDRRFVLGIAASYNRFDTNVKFTNKEKDISLFIDAEQSLGLPESNVSPMLYGTWRINNKHSMGFNVFRASREGSIFAVDLDIRDINVTGNIGMSDKSTFYYMNYGYTFVENPTSRVRGILGLYGVDLKLGIDAAGTITVKDAPVTSGRYSEELNQLIPLPIIGLDFFFAATDKWGLGSRFAFIGGSYSDYSALIVDARIMARYQMSKHVALMTGVNYFNGDIDINSEDERWEVRYGYDGVFLGLDFNW